jgi:hypothetical protein
MESHLKQYRNLIKKTITENIHREWERKEGKGKGKGKGTTTV